MSTQIRSIPKSIAVGTCLSLLAIFFGFALGGAFGAIEGPIKKRLDASGSAVLQSVYKGDAAAKDAVVKKSWEYLQRAHIHGGAIGTAALASIVTLILLCRLGLVAQITALAFGSGALLYSLFWLFAGLMAPGIGSTSVTKESLSFIAIPGAGLSIFGISGTIYSVIKAFFSKSDEA
jgi:hypothetical protein